MSKYYNKYIKYKYKFYSLLSGSTPRNNNSKTEPLIEPSNLSTDTEILIHFSLGNTGIGANLMEEGSLSINSLYQKISNLTRAQNNKPFTLYLNNNPLDPQSTDTLTDLGFLNGCLLKMIITD